MTDAVSCATESGQTELAVELLEQGQTIKQSDLRKYQKHEDTVSAFDSKLGERFKKLDGELNMLMETTGNIRGEDDSLAEELAAYVSPLLVFERPPSDLELFPRLKTFIRFPAHCTRHPCDESNTFC